MLSIRYSNSSSSFMCGGERLDLNPYVSLVATFVSGFRKKKAFQRIRYIKDSVFSISLCLKEFLVASEMFLIEYSKSFT